MLNPRQSLYEPDPASESRLMAAYRNVSAWSARHHRAARMAVPRGYHWLKLSWNPRHLWRAATVSGMLGVVLTISLLFQGSLPKPLPETQREEADDGLANAADLAADRSPFEIEEVPRPRAPQALLGTRLALQSVEPAFVTRLSAPTLQRVKFTVTSPLWARTGLVPNLRINHGRSDSFAAYATRPGVRISPFALAAHPSLSSDRPSVFGQGAVTTSGFRVRTDWPRHTARGATVMLRLHIQNISSRDAEHVRIRQSLNRIEAVTATYPPAAVVGDEFLWEETDWPSGESRTYSLEVVPDVGSLAGNASVDVVGVMADFASDVEASQSGPRPSSIPFTPLTDLNELPDGPTPVPSFERTPAARSLPQPEIERTQPLVVDDDTLPDRPSLAPSPDPLLVEDLPTQFPLRPTVEDTLPDRPAQPATRPSLTALKMQMLLPESRVGQVAAIQFIVTNVGPLPSEQTVLKVQLPSALVHPMGDELQLPIGRLTPGESFKTTLYADVVGARGLAVTAITEAQNAGAQKTDGVLPLTNGGRTSAQKLPQSNLQSVARMRVRIGR